MQEGVKGEGGRGGEGEVGGWGFASAGVRKVEATNTGRDGAEVARLWVVQEGLKEGGEGESGSV